MHVCIVYGTRPEYLKVLSVIRSLSAEQRTVLRICQHSDIAEPDLSFDISMTIDEQQPNCTIPRLDWLASQIMLKMAGSIRNATHVLIQGDTATAFYAAVTAFQNRKAIIHLEAGMRSYDLLNPYPEEGYRQMISRLADIHLVPHSHNANILEKEGVTKTGSKIFVVGNTILDLVRQYALCTSLGNTVIITMHRRENLPFMEDFVKALKLCVQVHSHLQFVWYLHPNPMLQCKVRKMLEQYGLSSIHVRMPVSHKELIEHIASCFCMLTDSGGIQEEAAYLGKPCIVLRRCTERDQIPFPYLQMVHDPFDKLQEAMARVPNIPLPACYVYGEGRSSEEIIHIISKKTQV